jgi:hypothetical protein
MNLSIRSAWTLAIALSAMVLIPAAWAWAGAARAERTQSQRLTSISQKVQTIAELRSGLPDWTLTPKAASTLAPQVSSALAAAGLPASAMSCLSADSGGNQVTDNRSSSVQARSRRATLQLTGLTLPQLGKFLQVWREREPAWVVSQIDVAPEAAAQAGNISQTGGDLPLRTTLTLETLTLERGGVR